MKTYGEIVEVSTINIGENATADAAISATTISVTDASTFNELGGQVRINGTPYAYTGADFTANTIELLTGLEDAVVEDDRVELFPAQAVKRATIDLGIPEGEAVQVIVPHGLTAVLTDGMREEEERETALLVERQPGELFLEDVLASPAGVQSSTYVQGTEGWVLNDQDRQMDNLNVVDQIGVDTLSARAIFLDGQDLSLEGVGTLAKGIVAHDTRSGGTDTAKTAGTELKLFEFSAGALQADRLYRLTVNAYLTGASSNGIWIFRVRYTTDGSTPGISSTTLRSYDVNMPSGIDLRMLDYSKVFTLAADTDNFRACLTLTRLSGTGTLGMSFSRSIDVYVEDLGLFAAAAEAGTLSQKSYADATPADADPIKTYTRTWHSTWTRSFDGDDGVRNPDDDDLYQGYYSSTHGRTKSLIGFDYASIQAALAGATIKSVKLTYRVKHAWSNAGAELHISSHSNTSKPSSWNGGSVAVNLLITSGNKEGSTYTKSLGTSIGNELKNGTKRGLGFGPGNHGTSTDYAYMYGGDSSSSRPRLTITYSK